MQEVLGSSIFVFATWCVLSRHFSDGVVAKAFLSLAAISAFVVVVDGHNMRASVSAGILLVIGLLYAYYRKPAGHRWIFDRREQQRPQRPS